MRQTAIEELKKDYAAHVKAARAGDPRSAHAADETLVRLEELGVDPSWTRSARKESGIEARHYQHRARDEEPS